MNSYLPVDSGFAHIDELHSEKHHAHEEYVITLMLAGYVTFEGEQSVNIKPGMLTLVPSGMPHALVKGKNMQVHWLSFAPYSIHLDEKHELMRPFAQVRKGALPIFKLPSARLDYVINLFNEVQNELTAGKSSKVLESLVCLILNEAGKASKLTLVDLGAETKVSKAMQYIQSHSCEGISLKDVASALHISPAYLATKVKQSTGYTVGQWIIRHRLKRAMELLANTDEKVEQIGLSLGWQDVTHFIRQFKKFHQQTPAAWRRGQKSQQ
ncbi:AraC family transcriptional regulator [Thalassomonas actiniarum]|uniref:Helix-turn-helix transcriptional regulator n=1 Tax=Thalassomonas actiniarum TaxID=485447 RepID=A0AAE9YWA6_9GAMM|nr:AraC family transcriptional regulator [Thalassomonas actiniarum]WDE02456.1 helix-turn-helix transcriptional regulator [Thalassomonas actiniarum]